MHKIIRKTLRNKLANNCFIYLILEATKWFFEVVVQSFKVDLQACYNGTVVVTWSRGKL